MPEANEEALDLLHTRNYDTRMYALPEGRVRAIGTVRDTKPAGMYIEHDVEPLTIHLMKVVLDVEVATMTIVDAHVEFDAFPNDSCPSIVDHYGKLVGLSVARGFNRQVRELFGGPRACTHTTALLQAMGPVIVQSLWSLRMRDREARGIGPFEQVEGETRNPLANLNTCHVWAEDGELVAGVRAGESPGIPVWVRRRYDELGWDLEEWKRENGRT